MAMQTLSRLGRGELTLGSMRGRDLANARAFTMTAGIWAGILTGAWFGWRALGQRGQERLAANVGVSARELTHYFMTAFTVEKVAAKGLFVAGLFHFLRAKADRSSEPA
jgi:hypothetical protein